MNVKSRTCVTAVALFLGLTACGGGGSDTSPDPFSFSPAEVKTDVKGKIVLVTATLGGFEGTLQASAEFVDVAEGTPHLFVNGDSSGKAASVPVTAGDELSLRIVVLGDFVSGAEKGHQLTHGDHIVARVTVGEGEKAQEATFTVTYVDMQAPEVAVHFPPMRATTDVKLDNNPVITVRGRAIDEVGVASIKVNGVDAELDPETGEWHADYALTAGLQKIPVVVEDAAGNAAKTSVVVEHVDTLDGYVLGAGDTGNFVDALLDTGSNSRLLFAANNLYRLDAASGDRVKILGKEDVDNFLKALARVNANLILIGGTGGVHAYDTSSGSASALSVVGDDKGADAEFDIARLAVDPAQGVAYGFKRDVSPLVWRIDLATGIRMALPQVSVSGYPVDLDFHAESATLFATFSNDCAVYTFNPKTGAAVVKVPSGDIASGKVRCVKHLDMDPLTGMAYGVNGAHGEDAFPGIFRFEDPASGAAELILDASDPAFGPLFDASFVDGLEVDFDNHVAFLIQDGDNEYGDRIYAIDLKTGHRVVVSLQR